MQFFTGAIKVEKNLRHQSSIKSDYSDVLWHAVVELMPLMCRFDNSNYRMVPLDT